MRFPDLEQVALAAGTTARRFPFTLLSAFAAGGVAMVLVDGSGDQDPLVRWLLAAILGIALLFSIESASERRPEGRLRLWGTTLALAILLAFGWFSAGWTQTHHFERFGQLLLAFHLLAAFAAFVGTREENGFWQFNRALFLRFATSTLYASVLFAGLAIALASIDALFGVDIRDVTYARLWVFMAFAVHPWMFLAGLPRDIPALEQERSYPQALKVFAQFILVPLVTVYLAILTAYLVRVIVTQEWPSGWIGWLVSSVSAVGTLALLLVHPVRDDEGNGWVRGYARWFWVALMPSIVMLFFAIGKRINQYGFTERRYFLLFLAVWIAVVAVWFAITRSRRIRFIPVSLAVVAGLSYFGPWGAYAVSERSQVARLTTVLAEAGATSFPVSAGTELAGEPEAARQVSDILRYLYGTHSVDVVARVVDLPVEADTLTQVITRGTATLLAQTTAESIGMRYFQPWETVGEGFANLNVDGELWPAPTEVYQVVFRTYLGPRRRDPFDVAGHEVHVTLDTAAVALTFSLDGAQALQLPLAPIMALFPDGDVVGNTPIAPERLVVTGISDRLRTRVHVRNLNALREQGELNLQTGEADIFLTVVEPPSP